MKTLLITALVSLNIFSVDAQGLNVGEVYIAHEDLDPMTYTIGCVPDVLYYMGDKYLIDRMFLSGKEGSDKIYPELSSTDAVFTTGTEAMITGHNYYGKWLLKDSALYLRDIGFYDNRVHRYYPNQERYKVMERFTGCKFLLSKNSNFTNLIPQETPLGSMKVSCINGVFYVRRVRNAHQERLKEWYDKPYYKLIFKDGMLISSQSIKPDNSPKKNPRKRAPIPPPYLRRR